MEAAAVNSGVGVAAGAAERSHEPRVIHPHVGDFNATASLTPALRARAPVKGTVLRPRDGGAPLPARVPSTRNTRTSSKTVNRPGKSVKVTRAKTTEGHARSGMFAKDGDAARAARFDVMFTNTTACGFVVSSATLLDFRRAALQNVGATLSCRVPPPPLLSPLHLPWRASSLLSPFVTVLPPAMESQCMATYTSNARPVGSLDTLIIPSVPHAIMKVKHVLQLRFGNPQSIGGDWVGDELICLFAGIANKLNDSTRVVRATTTNTTSSGSAVRATTSGTMDCDAAGACRTFVYPPILFCCNALLNVGHAPTYFVNSSPVTKAVGVSPVSVGTSGRAKQTATTGAAGVNPTLFWPRTLDMPQFKDARLVLIPFCLGNTHWILACVDLFKHQFVILDSLSQDSPRPVVYQRLLDIWSLLWVGRPPGYHDLPGDNDIWKLIVRTDTPQQPDGSSCGVFTIVAFLCFSMGEPFFAAHVPGGQIGFRDFIRAWLFRLVWAMATSDGSIDSLRMPTTTSTAAAVLPDTTICAFLSSCATAPVREAGYTVDGTGTASAGVAPSSALCGCRLAPVVSVLTLHPVPLVGLQHPSTLCWLNAAVQALLWNSVLVNDLKGVRPARSSAPIGDRFLSHFGATVREVTTTTMGTQAVTLATADDLMACIGWARSQTQDAGEAIDFLLRQCCAAGDAKLEEATVHSLVRNSSVLACTQVRSDHYTVLARTKRCDEGTTIDMTFNPVSEWLDTGISIGVGSIPAGDRLSLSTSEVWYTWTLEELIAAEFEEGSYTTDCDRLPASSKCRSRLHLYRQYLVHAPAMLKVRIKRDVGNTDMVQVPLILHLTAFSAAPNFVDEDDGVHIGIQPLSRVSATYRFRSCVTHVASRDHYVAVRVSYTDSKCSCVSSATCVILDDSKASTWAWDSKVIQELVMGASVLFFERVDMTARPVDVDMSEDD